MNHIDNKFEKLSFWQLIQRERIEIPIIQRDYAQGRKDKIEIRNNFLGKLAKAIKNDQILELDFIYGSKKSDTTHPLDGQQRLTTLFLLHWYYACKEGHLKESAEILSRFTYQTRTSSREFCEELVKHGVDFDALLTVDLHQQLSKTIVNTHWFFLSWKKDPTISAMLIMLDSIHSHNILSTQHDAWNKLTKGNRITFLYIDLEGFGLSDDLYIKMNARGKELTEFENFKAKFEQHVEASDCDQEIKRTFLQKIDGEWTDFFWSYKSQMNQFFDEKYYNFFRIMATNHYARKFDGQVDFEDEIRKLRSRDKNNRLEKDIKVTFSEYLGLSCFDKEYISSVYRALEKLRDNKNANETAKFFSHTNYIDEAEILDDALKLSLEYADLVLFYGYLQFLIHSDSLEKDNGQFADWMRIIRNLVEGSRLWYYNNAREYANSIKSIAELVPNRNHILQHLAAAESKSISGFRERQVEEEIIKAKLIMKSNTWRVLIIDAENHLYFNGQIEFLLNFSGIVEYYKRNSNLNWTETEDEMYRRAFNIYTNKAKAVFDDDGLFDFGDFAFERALLANGDYLLTKGRNHSFLINSERDISWKRLLRDNTEKRQLVKKMFDSFESTNRSDIKAKLEELIATFSDKEDWRYNFIKIPETIGACESNKLVRWTDNDDILLLQSSTTSGYHCEYFSYALYLTIRGYFVNIEYKSQRSRDEEKYISVNDDDLKISFVNTSEGRKFKVFDTKLNEPNFFTHADDVEQYLRRLPVN